MKGAKTAPRGKTAGRVIDPKNPRRGDVCAQLAVEVPGDNLASKGLSSHPMVSLPLCLTIKRISRDVRSVHVDALVTAADGASVRFMPLDMSPQIKPAEVVAILQATVTNMAESLFKRGEAEVVGAASEKDFEDLLGKKFLGSVSS